MAHDFDSLWGSLESIPTEKPDPDFLSQMQTKALLHAEKKVLMPTGALWIVIICFVIAVSVNVLVVKNMQHPSSDTTTEDNSVYTPIIELYEEN